MQSTRTAPQLGEHNTEVYCGGNQVWERAWTRSSRPRAFEPS